MQLYQLLKADHECTCFLLTVPTMCGNSSRHYVVSNSYTRVAGVVGVVGVVGVAALLREMNGDELCRDQRLKLRKLG
ncbi:MAG TPA: hypothetical protein VFK47_18725 [Ktedonobacteraceae bacterium]|nr:hypothetical protein [Ktedonobacteraceae bacterium]